MLNINLLTFNAFSENTYLISNENKQCWIVDPGMYEQRETDQIISLIEKNGLVPQSIINTHTHIDHVFGVDALKNRYKIPFGIHEAELPVLSSASGAAMLFGFEFPVIPKPDFFIGTKEKLMLGDDELEVRFTPGHSPGSISFYYPAGKWVISGDALFNGSIGRTDLPGGNFDTLISSIKSALLTLPDDTVVFSGHGPETTILAEKTHNQFLQ